METKLQEGFKLPRDSQLPKKSLNLILLDPPINLGLFKIIDFKYFHYR